MHLEELEDPQKSAEEGTKVITRQEYVSRLHELKDEITQAWKTSDRVAALKLSIKVMMLNYILPLVEDKRINNEKERFMFLKMVSFFRKKEEII